MRVLFLSMHYPPDVAATGQLVAELAEDVVSAGHEAIVVAARPCYTRSTDKPYRLLEREDRNGVEIHWLGVPSLGRRGVWSRLIPFAGYFFGAAIRCLFFRRVNVVFAQSTPPLLAGILAAALALLPGRRFVYNLQDVYPELGQALGVLGDGVLTDVLRKIERRLRRRADVVTVLAEDMRLRLLATDPELTNVQIVPNWADTEQVYPVADSENHFLQEHDLKNRFVVMYSGNLGRAHGVEILPAVAESLRDLTDLVLLVIGEGPARSEIEELVGRKQLTNVIFLPYQSKELLHESLSAADVSLILQRSSASGLVVPSKLYGILASGRCTVAAVPADCEVARVLHEEQAGVVFAPGDADGIASAIRQLYRDRTHARHMGQRARVAAVHRHDRKHMTQRYLQLFAKVTAAA